LGACGITGLAVLLWWVRSGFSCVDCFSFFARFCYGCSARSLLAVSTGAPFIPFNGAAPRAVRFLHLVAIQQPFFVLLSFALYDSFILQQRR